MTGERAAEDLSAVLAEVGSPSREAQRAGCERALALLSGSPALLSALRELLWKGSPYERFGAAYVLFRARRPGIALLPALLAALGLPDGDRRWEAAQMLATLGRIEGEVAAVLADSARRSPDPVQRRMCLFVLRELGGGLPEVAGILLEALDDPEAPVRRAALSSLVKLGPACEPGRQKQLAERVRRILEADADPRMRALATAVAAELVRAGVESAEALREALAALRQAGDPALERAAGLALQRLS